MKARSIPDDGSTVALDTVVFIYFLEQHDTYYSGVRHLFERIESGNIAAVMSTLVFSELLVPAYRKDELRRAREVTRLLLRFPNLSVLPVTYDVSEDAARLRARYGLRTPDAIHAATALAAGADGLCTNDKRLRCLRPEIEVWLVDDLVRS